MHCHSLHPLDQQVLVDVVHILCLLSKDEDRWRCLLQALQQVDQLGLLLYIFHLLQQAAGPLQGTRPGGEGSCQVLRARQDFFRQVLQMS